jgi:hypothetical protein
MVFSPRIQNPNVAVLVASSHLILDLEIVLKTHLRLSMLLSANQQLNQICGLPSSTLIVNMIPLSFLAMSAPRVIRSITIKLHHSQAMSHFPASYAMMYVEWIPE